MTALVFNSKYTANIGTKSQINTPCSNLM